MSTHLQGTTRVKNAVFVVIGVWFVAALVGGAFGIFDTPGRLPAPVGVFFLGPLVGFLGAYLGSARMRDAVHAIPLWKLTIAHVWRFVGLAFVIGGITRALPPQFGYPEGIGDLVTAAAAIPLAFALRRRPQAPRTRTLLVAWNAFGLLDLVSAICLGILYSPSTFGLLRTSVSTQPMTQLPGSIIPTFFVPLFILTHLLAFARRREVGGGGSSPTGIAPRPQTNMQFDQEAYR